MSDVLSIIALFVALSTAAVVAITQIMVSRNLNKINDTMQRFFVALINKVEIN